MYQDRIETNMSVASIFMKEKDILGGSDGIRVFTACIYSVSVGVHAGSHAGEVRHQSPCEDLFTYYTLIYLRCYTSPL
jgi:hypothetical protein